MLLQVAVILDVVPFWPTVWPALVAGLAAAILGGGLLLWIGYIKIDRRLHLVERAEREAESEVRDRRMRDASLHIAHDELQSIAAHIPIFRTAIDDGKVPYPPFDENGWALLSQVQALSTVRPDTAEKIILAYNRVRSANGQLTEYASTMTGATGALVHSALASAANEDGTLPPLAHEVYEQLQARQGDLRRGLSNRLTDLRKRIDEAIDAIEAELGNALAVPSVQRNYVPNGPIDDLTA